LGEREKLTGDWGGARSALANRGVVVTLDYIGENAERSARRLAARDLL
jgi:carbohydrate-selective porin OprB